MQLWTAVIESAGPIVAVIISGYFNRRSTEKVHKIVNQQRTDGQRYQQDLRGALTAAGIPVPPDQSLPQPPERPPG